MSYQFFTEALAGYPEYQVNEAFVRWVREMAHKIDYLHEHAVALGLDIEAEIQEEAAILTEAGGFTAPLWRGFWQDRVLAKIEDDAQGGGV